MRGLLVAARAAGRGQTLLTRQGGAAGGRVVLHGAVHAVLLKQLLIYELVVLAGKRTAVSLSSGYNKGHWLASVPFTTVVRRGSPLHAHRALCLKRSVPRVSRLTSANSSGQGDDSPSPVLAATGSVCSLHHNCVARRGAGAMMWA